MGFSEIIIEENNFIFSFMGFFTGVILTARFFFGLFGTEIISFLSFFSFLGLISSTAYTYL